MVQNCERRMLMFSIRLFEGSKCIKAGCNLSTTFVFFFCVFMCFPIRVFCICVFVMVVVFLKSQMTERRTIRSQRHWPQESVHVYLCVCVFFLICVCVCLWRLENGQGNNAAGLNVLGLKSQWPGHAVCAPDHHRRLLSKQLATSRNQRRNA